MLISCLAAVMNTDTLAAPVTDATTDATDPAALDSGDFLGMMTPLFDRKSRDAYDYNSDLNGPPVPFECLAIDAILSAVVLPPHTRQRASTEHSHTPMD